MPQDSNILNDIKQVLDISSRVDERVKTIQVNQQELNSRMNQMLSELSQLSARVIVLESRNGTKLHEVQDVVNDLNVKVEKINVGGTECFNKFLAEEKEQSGDFYDKIDELDTKIEILNTKIKMLERDNDGWQSKVKLYGGLVIQGIWVLIVCFMLAKFGLSTSPLP